MKPIKFTKGTFSVSYMNNSYPVEGYVSEFFGIHKVGRTGWRLTHLVSGLAVCSAYYPTKARAMEYANKFYNVLTPELWGSMFPFQSLTDAKRDELFTLAREAVKS